MAALDLLHARLEQIAGQIPAPAAPAAPAATRQRQNLIALELAGPVLPVLPLAEVRQSLNAAIHEYLALDMPTYRLLCRVDPGVGKTHALVQAAIAAQQAGKRVAYVMPRHDFIVDCQAITEELGHDPAIWYVWRGRHAGHDEQSGNCHHAPAMAGWLARGHQAIKFCSGVCGWDYIQNGCDYHAQADQAVMPLGVYNGITRYPIVALQHAHIATGHVLMEQFDLLIGDESPLAVFPHAWQIPADQIAPANLDHDDAAWPILAAFAAAAVTMAGDATLSGPELVQLAGGADAILEAARRTDVEHLASTIRNPALVDAAPYNHAADTLRLLATEARAAALGQPYIARATVTRAGLTLLLKNYSTGQLPARVIWADATGDADLYARVTGWRIQTFSASVALAAPVRQINDSTYSKTAMMAGKKPSTKAIKAARSIKLLAEKHGYRRPLVVSYSELAPLFDWCDFTYFHGNRGSNAYKDCDAVFVLGTPMPALEQITLMATMLYAERSEPFFDQWCSEARAYAGQPMAHQTGGFWSDTDLQLLLDQVREREILQSAHRVRPVLAPRDIWLITALPIAELAPAELLSMKQAIGVDLAGIDTDTFFDALDVASVEIALKGHCTSEDLTLQLECSRATAYKYLDALALFDPDQFAPVKIRAIGRGASRRAIGSRENL